VAIDVETLRTERDRLKESLREVEVEQRKLEASIKSLRQQELKVKREIEALSTLIELAEGKGESGD